MKMNFSKHDVIKTLNDAEELFVNYRANPNFRIFEQFSEEELNKATGNALSLICNLSQFLTCMNEYRTNPRFR